MSDLRWKAKYAWTVRYRRTTWTYRQSRHYRTRRAAERFIDRLLSGDYELAPLAECRLEREPLGPSEVVWTLEEADR